MKKLLFVFTTVAAVTTFLGAGLAAAQELYVTDQTSDQLTIINTSTAAESTISNPLSETFLNAPTGIAVDTDAASTYYGDVFVANAGNGTTGNGSVAIYDPTTASFLPDLATGLTNPEGIAFDSSGNLYVTSDTASGSITKYSGTSLLTVNSSYATSLSNPYGVTANALNTLFVSVTGSGGGLVTIPGAGIVNSFNPSFSPSATPTGPEGVIIGPAGDLYVVYSNGSSPNVGQITLNGTGSIAVSSLGSSSNIPLGLIFDNAGKPNLYVADFGANMVTVYTQQSINNNGEYTYVASGTTYSTGGGPTFLAFDPLTATVPEPGTYAMMLGGLAALYFFQRRRSAAPVKV